MALYFQNQIKRNLSFVILNPVMDLFKESILSFHPVFTNDFEHRPTLPLLHIFNPRLLDVFFYYMKLELLLSAISFLLILLSKSSPIGDDSDHYSERRWEMVENQIISRGIRDSSVIQAMLKVPRQEFVPEQYRDAAYNDGPVPIGRGVTVSQPYIVALMTELLRPVAGMKVLEVGTGSGYQSAVLVETGCELYTIEILEDIALRAREILDDLGYSKIHYKIGDGYEGWEEHAPFDGIIVTAAPGHIPRKLVEQLKPYGRIIIPVGDENQELLLIEKTEEGIVTKRVTSVRFVPMTGEPDKE